MTSKLLFRLLPVQILLAAIGTINGIVSSLFASNSVGLEAMSAVPLTGLYYHDPDAPVYMMTVWGFRLLPLCMPLAVIRMHFSCYGQTIGRNLMVNILEALDGCVFVCLLTALMIPSIGMNSVYIANIMNGVFSILYLMGYAAMKIRRIPGKMEEFMAIPPDFGVPEEQRIDCTVRTMDDVICISEAVQRFCLDQGIDQRRAFFAGLSMEEMAGNVVTHGFHKDKKKHSVEIRVVHKDDNLLLRIKDDCAPFDPAELSGIFNPEDITRNIGIRIVYGIADEIDYQNILGMNVLTIHI